MKRIILYSLLVAAILFSCAPVKESVIDLAKAVGENETPLLSSLASEIRYIPLETQQESVLDRPTHIYVYNSEIFIECHMMKFFRVFDTNGNYLRTVDRHGNGPEEYRTFFDSTFEMEGDGVISVLERHMIRRYDTQGNFIGTIDLDQNALRYYRNLEYLGNGMYKLDATVNDSVSVVLFDSNGKEIDSKLVGISFTQKYESISLSVPPVVSFSNDNFLVQNVGMDTIYRYDRNLNRSFAYQIDCGKYDYLYKTNDMFNMIQFAIGCLIDSQNYLIMGVTLPKNEFAHLRNDNAESFRLIYEKSTGKTYFPKVGPQYKVAGFKNDLDNGPAFSPKYLVGNKMYSFIDAIDFIESAEFSGSEQMKEVASKLTEDSNPVLVEVTLK